MSTIYDDIDEIDENQAKRIFDFLSKKAESIGGKRLDIVEYNGSFAHAYVIYTIATMRDDGMSIDGYVGTFNKKDGWGEFIDFDLRDREYCKYQVIVDKILTLCKNNDLCIPCEKYGTTCVIVDKGTTLHQLLIEIDLVGCYDNK